MMRVRLGRAGTVLLAFFALSSPVLAQEPQGGDSGNPGHFQMNKRGAIEVLRARNYMVEHPDVAGQLRANPSLLDDDDFLDAHPGLRQFKEQHPNLRSEMKEHP
jgi:hypothetical protein